MPAMQSVPSVLSPAESRSAPCMPKLSMTALVTTGVTMSARDGPMVQVRLKARPTLSPACTGMWAWRIGKISSPKL